MQNSKFPFVLVLVLVLVLGVPGVFEGENEKEPLRHYFCNCLSILIFHAPVVHHQPLAEEISNFSAGEGNRP